MGDVLGNRFAAITPDDHAGSIWIASILCLVYSVLTLALRTHLRLRIYGLDDYIAMVATVSISVHAPDHRLSKAAADPGGRGDCNIDRTTPWTRQDSRSAPRTRVEQGKPSELYSCLNKTSVTNMTRRPLRDRYCSSFLRRQQKRQSCA